MTALFLSLIMMVQGTEPGARDTLSNDRPQFPIGLAKDHEFLEKVNQASINEPAGVGSLMETAAKEGSLIALPSGTRAKQVSARTLRGPIFKEIIQVEILEGPQAGLKGWVTSETLMTGAESAERKRAKEGGETGASKYKPLYRDPAAGEKAFLAPQPTMLGMVRHLIRVANVDESVAAVFKEWQGAPESARDAILKSLESKKAIFFTTVNTEVQVQKVFPDQRINDIYPVQVEIRTGPFKGRIGWVPVTVVSPIPGKAGKVGQAQASTRSEEIQKTLERRGAIKKKQALNRAQTREEQRAKAASDLAEQQRGQALSQSELQLQLIRQQAAIAEAQAASQTVLNQELIRAIRERRLRDAQLNGNGVYYGPNGPMTLDEFLRSRQR